MTPRSLSDAVVREVPLLDEGQSLGECASAVVAAGVPALPVVDGESRLSGIFGEREFIGAVFPGYVGELGYAGFVRRGTEDLLEKRIDAVRAPVAAYVNREHIDVGPDHSDLQLAEIFLHHRVLIIPVADGGRVLGIVTRSDFFSELVARFERA